MKLKKRAKLKEKGIPKYPISTSFNKSLEKSVVMMSKLKGEHLDINWAYAGLQVLECISSVLIQ